MASQIVQILNVIIVPVIIYELIVRLYQWITGTFLGESL